MTVLSGERRAVGAAIVCSLSLAGYAALLLVSLNRWPIPDMEIRSPEPPSPVSPGPPAPVASIDSVPDRLLRGDGLGGVLRRNGFPSTEVVRTFDSVLDLRRLRTGQELWLHRDPSGEPARVDIHIDDLRVVSAERMSDGRWEARESQVDPDVSRELVAGTVETSLYDSMLAAGERPELAGLVGTVLEYQMDMRRDTRRGDSWSVLVDKIVVEGKFRGYGQTHAVRFVNAGEEIFAFRYGFPDGSEGFYDENGRALRRAFLMSPVRYTRISGVFTSRRLHPVHRVYRPHYGVDYAAPQGTPVIATGDGKVIDAGMRGPNGNMVTIRHSGGYQTKYLHLSRIPDHIRAGRRVEQREVIGYVGSTGTSTGPHVDYRLYRDGRPINPRANPMPEGPPIPDQHRADFEARRDRLVAALRSGGDAAERRRRDSPTRTTTLLTE